MSKSAQVLIYSFEYETASQPFLVKKASYRTSTAPIDLAVTGNLIAIADLMKSVSVVQYKSGQAGMPDSLEEVARHFQTAWGTAVAHVDQNTFLESDAEGNLMVLFQDIHGVTAEDRRRLQVTSEIRLGEMVNRIRRIDVPTSPDAVVIPRAFLATVSFRYAAAFSADILNVSDSIGRRLDIPLRSHYWKVPGSPDAVTSEHGRVGA